MVLSTWVITHPLATLVFVVVLLCGCSTDSDSPEDQVRALIGRAQAAAEAQDTKVLEQMVAVDYADERGQDKRAIAALIRYYFLQHKSIHLFTKIEDLTVDNSTRKAHATVYAAMAGQRIEGSDALARLRADLHRFELDFVEKDDGKWKVLWASWRRATVDDFL
ncbi:MAG: hypothetical protein OEU36_00215 [Gammaproteobacteria bacterium]|nr:hypothetical protein [Gammaproteobacteria bacterium]